MDHQGRADARRVGDGAQPDVEPVLAELLDRGVADPGDRCPIID